MGSRGRQKYKNNSSDSETDSETEPKFNSTKPVCFIGLQTNDNRSYWSSRGKRLHPDIYANCSEDIMPHLSSLFQASPVPSCPNGNEQWLMKNRVNATIPDNATLCGKHRSKYGIGFKDNKCSYPGHVTEAKKRKGKTDIRLISISKLKAIKFMHSSPLGKFTSTNRLDMVYNM